MLASDPAQMPRRTDKKTCGYCEASPMACRSLAWLSGRLCCQSCPGNHDLAHARDGHPNNPNNDQEVTR